MSGTPTSRQVLVLWCLLGRGGSALQSVLAPRVGKADREALVAGRYVEATRQGRSVRLSVTDRGWDWAGKHLREPLPPAFRVLQDWMERIDADLARSGRTLADLIGPPPEEPPAPAPRPVSEVRRPAKARQPSAKAVRARIGAAYLALTGGETAKAVRLSALRSELKDLDRATVDAGLAAILRGDPTARLSQFSDPKSLDDAERAAAFSPAGEPFHIIRIQS
ncbi:hypothetical protein AFCDBAGC_2067 [Methylobacterium cerastii]|uniref:Uncharacterized protein n=1 Tax=Methylobacterium cerastii TaxID=932741 RepID=A0ABQ4QG81_9HYPH|nr:hypothetical protein [Methylobacterium cerastii]GJD44202.1 hypothetical protein AFCDBAGC_2067 [Methylobacterium cerastii]